MNPHSYDFLIVLHGITAVPDTRDVHAHSQINAMLIEDAKQFGKIVLLSWRLYDLRELKVTDEVDLLVKPHKFTGLNQATMKKISVTSQQINENGVSLPEALQKFNAMVFNEFITKNQTFCLVTFGDDLLTRILPTDAKDIGLKLPSHFMTYFDACNEFRKCYKYVGSMSSINEYLAYFKLNPTQPLMSQPPGGVEATSLVRLVNKMARDGHKFVTPKILNPSFQLVNDPGNDGSRDSRSNKRWNTFIRGRSPDAFRNPTKIWYIRLRGLPYKARELEIMEFLRGIRIYKENIVFMHDDEGKHTGEAYIQLLNEQDFREALSFNLGDMGSRYIEVLETNENEFIKAKKSEYPDGREKNVDALTQWGHILKIEYGIVRLRGLPYSCTESDIRAFFKNYNIINDGIKRAVIGGKPSGECYVVFGSRGEANQSLTLNMDKIGGRFIEVFMSSHSELANFLVHNLGDQGSHIKETLPNIPIEQRRSTVLVNGLPYTASRHDILAFFQGYNLKDENITMLPSHSGKFSGNALVTFENEIEAQRAIKNKHLRYLNNRYIELYEYR